MIDFEFSEEQNLFGEVVKDFAAREVAPLVDKYEKEKRFPVQLFPKLGEMGFLGIMFPEEYGGAGADKVTECIFVEEMGRVCAGIAMSINAHVGLGCLPLWKSGTEGQKQKYLVPGLAGRKIGAFALTEPGAGSDATGIETEAVKIDGKYILNGKKVWIGNAPVADFIIVAAYTDRDKRGEGISLLIVEKGFPGFSVTKKFEKVGHKASEHGELTFENCEVPEENLLGEREGGFGDLMDTLISARITHSIKSVGLAQAAFEYALKYSKERTQFGQPICNFQAIRMKLSEMASRLQAARQLVYFACDMKDTGKRCDLEAGMAKIISAETVEYVTREAMQIFGGYGYSKEYPVERFWRDGRVISIFEGTSEIQHEVIARRLLEL